MRAGILLGFVSLAAVCATAPVRVADPGVRPGSPAAGGPVAGVNPRHFANARREFLEVHSIAGDIEPGAGLGPRFNGTSCGGCHAYPAPGGSSPPRNPQPAMALAHGARNAIPAFVRPDGPVLAVRLRRPSGATSAGGVLPLFTVTGRTDAYTCAVPAPDLTNAAKLGFRIPTPLFGAGLIDNIPDAEILANHSTQAAAKARLGIRGEPNIGEDGAVGRFGWKAQHHALARFAAEAYETEMGVRTEASGYQPESLPPACYTLYEAAYDDPYYSSSYGDGAESPVFFFVEFMRFLKPPEAVAEFPGATVESVRDGRRLFEQVGCALCHTPSLRTGGASDLAALNHREASLYSDLLLHHMGPGLADGIVEGRAGSDEFRTAPLWGLGQRVFFLHDGRTSDLRAAIRDHAGDGGGLHSEADKVIGRFDRLSPAEQQDLIDFLRSL